MKTSFVGAITGLLIFAAPAFCSYSAVNDFPTVTSVSSPVSGPWSYGYNTTLIPFGFQLDNQVTTNYFGDGNVAGFYTTTTNPAFGGTYPLPAVLANISGGTLQHELSIVNWTPSLLLLHPGPTGDYAVVRFTAPSSATYNVSGLFTAIDSGVTSDYVIGPGASPLYSTYSTSQPQNTFSFQQHLAAGQTLDFAVGLGPQGQFYNDSTGFNAEITATPEPGFYMALGLGLSGLLLTVKRRKA